VVAIVASRAPGLPHDSCTALALALVADSCFVAAFIRGRLVLMLPTVFVVADCTEWRPRETLG